MSSVRRVLGVNTPPIFAVGDNQFIQNCQNACSNSEENCLRTPFCSKEILHGEPRTRTVSGNATGAHGEQHASTY
jgi:hypothetical protein